jgi:ribosomal protein S18 acetylase RimI-like enzyme
MHTRVVDLRQASALLVRPLEPGDVGTVAAVFARLGEASRRARFNGPKPCLTAAELEQLAKVDGSHHALVGYVEGDPAPAAIASLVRTGAHGAEIAFAVADEYQHRGVGSALAGELLADARAAGISEVTAFAGSENRATLALLRRISRILDIRLEGPEVSIRAAIA